MKYRSIFSFDKICMGGERNQELCLSSSKESTTNLGKANNISFSIFSLATGRKAINSCDGHFKPRTQGYNFASNHIHSFHGIRNNGPSKRVKFNPTCSISTVYLTQGRTLILERYLYAWIMVGLASQASLQPFITTLLQECRSTYSGT